MCADTRYAVSKTARSKEKLQKSVALSTSVEEFVCKEAGAAEETSD